MAKIEIPKGKYITGVEINDNNLSVSFASKKKVALFFICINSHYWPYLKDVIEDCKKHFLPHHYVDYFVWSDIPELDSEEYKTLSATPHFPLERIQDAVKFLRNQKDIHITHTDPVEWPAPTLMRYHLFLQKEEELKDYDYLFYMDADMRVLQKISDEILGEALTAAPHPGYALASKLIPPYEPNKDSTAYIHRLGQLAPDENGVTRFLPFYAAGGFQGGTRSEFIKAMKVMKENIDRDFDKNYVAIWNDESHWNKYLWDYKKHITFLDVSYVYPDSLIKEYYEPKIWGRSFEPKIVTLTKPFSLSKQAGSEVNQLMGVSDRRFQCPECKEYFETPGYEVTKVHGCPGVGKPHQLDLKKL